MCDLSKLLCLILLFHLVQEEDANVRSAVYVNVAQLRQSFSESPPSPSYLDPEGWEVHVDQESGHEYYYHPSTGRTTWDSPFLEPSSPCLPSPPQSPALSPSAASPPAWPSDWEQLVDETSGRPYYYNPMSGETSWEPPQQQSPYPPPAMEPMSVHRFLEDTAVRTAWLLYLARFSFTQGRACNGIRPRRLHRAHSLRSCQNRRGSRSVN